MDLNIENISRLDNNSSYYLSDNGEIKKSGLLHKFKCFFGLGIQDSEFPILLMQ